MKKPLLLLIGIVMTTALFSQESIEYPSAWMRADSSTLNGTIWQDVSGHDHFAVSSTGILPANYASMNFNKCFEIDNGDYFQIIIDSLTNTKANVIIVYETVDSVSENGLWSLQLDSVKRVGLTTQRILNNKGEIVFDTLNRLRKVVNYLSQSWERQNIGTFPHTISFGIADSIHLNGKIAEFIYFDHQMEDVTVTRWISYIAIKYGITLFQTNYLNSQNQCIWNYDTCPAFSYSIAGIGKDTLLGLNQKQTYFADNAIVFGIDSLFIDNEHNTAQTIESNFIVMGMDSNGLRNPTALYLTTGETITAYGKSKVQVTGNEASQYHTFLQVDGNIWNEDSALIALLIDRSGTGNYPLNEIELYFPNNIDADNILHFNDLQWDTDGNGMDAYCLVRVNADSILGADRLTQSQNHNSINTSSQALETQKFILSSQTQYNLYPNPNQGQFTLEIHYTEINDVTVKIYGSDGKLLKRIYGDNSAHYSFTEYIHTSGHYLIEINGNAEKKTLKMIVQ